MGLEMLSVSALLICWVLIINLFLHVFHVLYVYGYMCALACMHVKVRG